MTFAAGALVVALEAIRLLFRNSQLFCPERDPERSWNPADYGLDPSFVDDFGFESADGTVLHAWYCRAKNPIASVLYCHGNSGNLTFSAAKIPLLNASGLNVLLFDYRGFGRSSGRTTLAGVLDDAAAAAEEHDRIRPRDLPSILYGYSLGGAIGAQVAKEHPFDGVILQSTFTNLADMARVRFPKLPVHLISGTEFDTLAIVRELHLPLLIIHGTNDEVIPHWMGETLFKSCTKGHALVLLEGAMHTNLYDHSGPGIVKAIHRFALSLAPQKAAAATAKPPSPLQRIVRQIRKYAWFKPSLAPVAIES
jgi:uncharacterized protein